MPESAAAKRARERIARTLAASRRPSALAGHNLDYGQPIACSTSQSVALWRCATYPLRGAILWTTKPAQGGATSSQLANQVASQTVAAGGSPFGWCVPAQSPGFETAEVMALRDTAARPLWTRPRGLTADRVARRERARSRGLSHTGSEALLAATPNHDHARFSTGDCVRAGQEKGSALSKDEMERSHQCDTRMPPPSRDRHQRQHIAVG